MNLFRKEMENKVICEECRCWLSKHDAQVRYTNTDRAEYSKIYFCQAHTKPWEVRIATYDYDKDHSHLFFKGYQYFSQIEVDVKGKPIGYKKLTK